MPGRSAPEAPLRFATAAAFRRWLQRNHAASAGEWLAIAKKGTPGLGYVAAVEEALCFGWIDGQMKALDAGHFAQRFSPRRPRSAWAASNRARVARLQREGRMTPAGLAAVRVAKASGQWQALADVEAAKVPPDLAEALRAVGARRRFDAWAKSRRSLAIWSVVSAKRETTRARRVAAVLAELAPGR